MISYMATFPGSTNSLMAVCPTEVLSPQDMYAVFVASVEAA